MARDLGGSVTIIYGPGVPAHQAADVVVAVDATADGMAGGDGPGALTCQQTDGPPSGHRRVYQPQVAYLAVGAHHNEQPGARGGAIDKQVADFVAVAVEDGGKAVAGAGRLDGLPASIGRVIRVVGPFRAGEVQVPRQPVADAAGVADGRLVGEGGGVEVRVAALLGWVAEVIR